MSAVYNIYLHISRLPGAGHSCNQPGAITGHPVLGCLFRDVFASVFRTRFVGAFYPLIGHFGCHLGGLLETFSDFFSFCANSLDCTPSRTKTYFLQF